MLTFFVSVFVFFVFSFFYFSFSFFIGFLAFSSFFLFFSLYSNVLGDVFSSFLGSVDSFSVFLVVLTVWITMLMCLVSLKYDYTFNSPFIFFVFVLLLLFIVSVFFFTDNLLVFYVSFEASLLPTLLLILK